MDPLARYSLAQDIQIVLLIIFIVAGGALLVRGEHRWRPLGAMAVWFVVVAGGLWVFVPTPGGQSALIIHKTWRWIDPETATRWMLILDLLVVLALVWLTGGSERSCFSPLYFMLSTFTLLLLDVGPFFIGYSIAAIAFFALTLFGRNAEQFFGADKAHEDPLLVRMSRIMLWLISGACLYLAVHIDVERHKSNADTFVTKTSAEQPSTVVATPTAALGSGATPSQPPAAITPANTPTSSATGAAAKPIPTPIPAVTTPASTATPAPAPVRLTTYSEFLARLKGLHRKKENVQRQILRAYIGENVVWDVKFQGYRSGRKKETTVLFSETNAQAATYRAVRIGKAPEKYRRIIQNLHLGATIHIEGTLQAHSSTELFVRISVLTQSN